MEVVEVATGVVEGVAVMVAGVEAMEEASNETVTVAVEVVTEVAEAIRTDTESSNFPTVTRSFVQTLDNSHISQLMLDNALLAMLKNILSAMYLFVTIHVLKLDS